jgi:cytoskeletal protein RodZ
MSGGDSGAHAGLKIGPTLALARKEQGLSLKQVEEATKIRAAYLADLERENFDVLPAVYVQGSLKTYANFLQLDGEAMVRELKSRQVPEETPPYPLYVGPQQEDSLDDILTAAGGVAGEESRDVAEDDAKPALLPAGRNGYLFVGSAVLLVLAIAALALSFAGDTRPPAVSQVREPMISPAPQPSPPDAGEEASAQQPGQDDGQSGDEDGSGSGSSDDSQDEDRQSQDEQEPADPPQAQSSASASATATAEADRASARRQDEATAAPDRRSAAGTRASAPASPRPAGDGGSSNPSRGGGSGELEVEVNTGADDPVKLSGGPFD